MRRRKKRRGGNGNVLADLMANALGFVTLLLLPLLLRIDEAGTMITELEIIGKGLATEVAESRGKNIELKTVVILQEAEIGSLKTGLGELEEKLKKGNPVDVVFLIDVSASMTAQIESVQSAVVQIGKLFPRATKIRVGVVVFQPAGQYMEDRLRALDVDDASSLDRLTRFLRSIETVGGRVDVLGAINKGIAMFASSPNEDARQVLVLVSDAAPGESAVAGSVANDLVVDTLKQWKSDLQQDRRFLSLYGHPVQNAVRQIYKTIAEKTDSYFGDNPAKTFEVLFEAIYSPKQKDE